MKALAMPERRRGQKLAYSFDEDELTLAWRAVKAAGIPPGTPVAAVGLDVPAWFWSGTGLVADAAASWRLAAVPTTVGPAVVAHEGPLPDLEEAARALHRLAADRPEAEWQRHRLARDAPDAEADVPLGAFVLAARHEAVLAERMRLPGGRIVSWTAIGAGAAPSEFIRLQDAVGAYHVVLVESGGRRTVGLWSGESAPRVGEAVRPVLRRLFRMQGAWRHGIKFEPAEGAAPLRNPQAGPLRADPPHAG